MLINNTGNTIVVKSYDQSSIMKLNQGYNFKVNLIGNV